MMKNTLRSWRFPSTSSNSPSSFLGTDRLSLRKPARRSSFEPAISFREYIGPARKTSRPANTSRDVEDRRGQTTVSAGRLFGPVLLIGGAHALDLTEVPFGVLCVAFQQVEQRHFAVLGMVTLAQIGFLRQILQHFV